MGRVVAVTITGFVRAGTLGAAELEERCLAELGGR
jgi:hypothetical protein